MDKTLETNVSTVMTLVQHTSANTMDTGGIACEYLRSPSRLYAGDDQDGEVIGELRKTNSMERNKNTLELKMARDGPTLTNCSHVLEAVTLKAAKERVRMLSRNRTTGVFCSVKGEKQGEVAY